MGVRLQVAGGTIRSEWVPLRWNGHALVCHAVVDNEHWRGRLEMGTAVLVDIDFQEVAVNLHDALHAILDKRAIQESELQDLHDAVDAHAMGLTDSSQVRERREAAAASGLKQKYAGVPDLELLERAADGDLEARAERKRRRVMGEKVEAPAAAVGPTDAELEAKYATVDDQGILEAIIDGDADAKLERARRKRLASSATPTEASGA